MSRNDTPRYYTVGSNRFYQLMPNTGERLRIINYQNKYHKPSGIIWINGGWVNLLYQKGDVDRAARSLYSYLPSLSSLTVSGWDRTGRKMASDCLREKIKLPCLQMTPRVTWDTCPGPFTLSRFKQRADKGVIKNTDLYEVSQWVKSQSLKICLINQCVFCFVLFFLEIFCKLAIM